MSRHVKAANIAADERLLLQQLGTMLKSSNLVLYDDAEKDIRTVYEKIRNFGDENEINLVTSDMDHLTKVVQEKKDGFHRFCNAMDVLVGTDKTLDDVVWAVKELLKLV